VSKTVLICFFGIDGSGKSTLSGYLRDELIRRHYDVTYTWWLEGENTFIRKLIRPKRKKGNPTLKQKNGENKKSFTRAIMWSVYQRIVLFDYLLFGITKLWLPRLTTKSKVQILDRYMYDVIFSLYKEFNMSERRRDFLFLAYHFLLPKPDMILLIDVPPEVTFERKRHEILSIDAARVTYSNYQELYRIINSLNPGKAVRIDNTRELEIVKRDILNRALALLEGTHEE
jgi:thymidylate kinase